MSGAATPLSSRALIAENEAAQKTTTSPSATCADAVLRTRGARCPSTTCNRPGWPKREIAYGGDNGAMTRYDAIVVGAGPAGSTCAHRLASAGASVLVLDRARFPRDKPCGGGVTGRAARLLPFGVDPVVEDVVTSVRMRLRFGSWVERGDGEPLVLMTQRIKLDAYLLEQAAGAGAEVRDGMKVEHAQAGPEGVEVTAGASGCTRRLWSARTASTGSAAGRWSSAGTRRSELPWKAT